MHSECIQVTYNEMHTFQMAALYQRKNIIFGIYENKRRSVFAICSYKLWNHFTKRSQTK